MDAVGRFKEQLPADVACWLNESGHSDPAAAWRACEKPEWLLAMALAVDVDRSAIVSAAADVAQAALDACEDEEEETAVRALRLARAWLDERATSSEAWAAGFCTMDAAERMANPKTAAAMRAAACVAFACDDLADASFYAHRAYAAKAAEHAGLACDDGEGACARVRARIAIGAFVDAFAIASEPPPPMPGPETTEAGSDSFYA
jgi:hypothetical protein